MFGYRKTFSTVDELVRATSSRQFRRYWARKTGDRHPRQPRNARGVRAVIAAGKVFKAYRFEYDLPGIEFSGELRTVAASKGEP